MIIYNYMDSRGGGDKKKKVYFISQLAFHKKINE